MSLTLEGSRLEIAPKICMKDLRPTCTHADLRLIKDYYGSDGLSAFYMLLDGREPMIDTHGVDDYFLRRVRGIYAIPSYVDARKFYGDQLSSANAVITDLQTGILSAKQEAVGLKTEVATIPDSPFDRLRALSGRVGSDGVVKPVSVASSFQLKRQMYTAHAAAQIERRRISGNFEDNLDEIEDIFNRYLFIDNPGETNLKEVQTYHDNETNDVLGFRRCEKVDLDLLKNGHVKSTLFSVRRFEYSDKNGEQRIGEVYYNRRSKDKTASILKSIRKALANGGEIDPLKDVLDSCGLRLVAMGDKNMEDQLVRQVTNAIAKYSTENPDRGITFEVDDEVGTASEQNQLINFGRIQVRSIDSMVPVEVITEDLAEYLKKRYQVGVFDESKEKYTGQAHALYDIVRLRKVLPILFPAEIYSSVNIPAVVEGRMHIVAQMLRHENTK